MTNPTPEWFTNWMNRSTLLHQRCTLFFVVGCQKSGTTWIERLLNQHPQVACEGEGHFCDTLIPVMQQALNYYTNAQVESDRMDAAHQPLRDDLLGISRLLIDQILVRFIKAKPNPDAVTAVGEKTPEHSNSIPLLRELFPQAKFIHIIRDGRDACVSGWAHLNRKGQSDQFKSFAEYASYFAERHWLPYLIHARQEGHQAPGQYIEITYETLRADPVPGTTALFEFLQVDADPTTVQQAVDGASFKAMSGGRAPGQEDASSHMRKGIVGDWKNHFDDESLAAFNAHAEPLLRALGYETTATISA